MDKEDKMPNAQGTPDACARVTLPQHWLPNALCHATCFNALDPLSSQWLLCPMPNAQYPHFPFCWAAFCSANYYL
ncbi:MAG: hypothetical protein ACHBN1_34855 [Heteroscytonema crispum UTEX LB 1556]